MRVNHRSYSSCLVAIALALLLTTASSFAAQPSPRKPLPDGTVLESIDGKLADANDTWVFELTADANGISGPIPAGTRLELLPSAILEMLIADVNDRHTPMYRLSGLVTAYQGKNLLLPTYYLPLSKLKTGRSAATPEESIGFPRETAEPAIPPEVLAKLKERRAPRGPQGESHRPAGPLSRMLVDVIGVIDGGADGPIFTPDPYGWNISRTSHKLLPCGVLEQTLQRQATSPDPLRFNVAGLVTEFKGKTYLLLQRAVRAYDYGNFGG